MKRPGKKIGRPIKDARPGTRVSLGLKVTAGLKRQIEAAARESGRTQSQEAEFRIEQAFIDCAVIEFVRNLAAMQRAKRRRRK